MVSGNNNRLWVKKMRSKILVVDDDSGILDLLKLVLRGAGYSVAVASDGSTALKKLQALKPNLVILDLLLPGTNGFAVCEAIRGSAETAHIPVLVVTGLSGQLARLSGLDSGASDYLTKPFTAEEVLERVDSLLNASVASA